MNKQTEDDTNRTSASLSAAIPSPRKALAKYIEDISFWLVTTWAVTLVFPFHWMISIPTAFLLGVAIWTALFASRADRPKRYRRWFRLVTLTVVVVASVWALLGPVLIARPALYVVIRQGWNPLTSSFIPVKVGKEVVAHVMVVADPVRKAAYSVIAGQFKYVRVSALEDGEDSPYVRLPSLQQLTWAEDEPGLGIRESIDVFAVSNSIEFDLHLTDKRSIWFGSAATLSPLVSVESMGNSRTPPWHGVLVGHSEGGDAFKYVALLDLAMRAIIEGNNSEAWKLLQECVRAGSPNEMEQARALTLEARYAAAVSYAEQAAKSAPQNAEMWFLLGYAARLADRYQVIRVPIDVYQVSHLPFTVLPLDLTLVVAVAERLSRQHRQEDHDRNGDDEPKGCAQPT